MADLIISCSSSCSVSGKSFRYCIVLLVTAWCLTLVDSSTSSQSPATMVNVTKTIFFSNFSPDDPRVTDSVKLLGSAEISSEEGSIRIPRPFEAMDLRHQAGRAIYSSPVRFLDPLTLNPASFYTTFSFQFSNSSETQMMGINGGSGLTFIIVPDEFTVGRAGPWLGMLNDACQENYKVVAVEFDTRQNLEFGDPSDNHVGINLGSIVSTAAINASDVGVSLKDGSVHRAWISYDGQRRWMDVRLGLDGTGHNYYPSKALFSGRLDLSPFLNEYMFVGFSASTGNMTQIHNILSWNFTASSQASLRIPSSETCESKLVRDVGYGQVGQHKAKANPTPLRGVVIFVGVSTFVLFGFIICFLLNSRCRRVGNSKSAEDKVNKKPRPPNKPRRFSLSEISFATRAFSDLEILGSDSRGVCYRGKLSNGCQVAIKRFSEQFLTSQGVDRRRMLKEIAAVSRVRHPNLVPIRGWCHDNREIIVVYDFCINRSLDKWVFGVGVLPWSRRLKVIRDVAEALSFLHSKQHAHKNMKPTSVFLDISFRAALGDFGFVLSGVESRRFESAVSQTTDVFEFGIFVLEVVSGRKRLEMEGNEVSKEEKDLVDFAWRMHERDEKTKVVDRRMGSLVNLEQAVRVLEIGLLCTLNESKGRPCVAEVMEFLSLEKQIPELPASRPMALFPYNSTTGLCTGCSPFD